MGTDLHLHEREVRAARNQALFRAVNEKMRKLKEDVATLTRSFPIACECAGVYCLEMIEISAEDYLAVRSEPHRFVVLPGHVLAEVETVVREGAGYLVVEKTETAADVVELLALGRTASG
jgi:hypothetical protein